MEYLLRAQHFVKAKYTTVESTDRVPVFRKLQAGGDKTFRVQDSKGSDEGRTWSCEKVVPEILALEN